MPVVFFLCLRLRTWPGNNKNHFEYEDYGVLIITHTDARAKIRILHTYDPAISWQHVPFHFQSVPDLFSVSALISLTYDVLRFDRCTTMESVLDTTELKSRYCRGVLDTTLIYLFIQIAYYTHMGQAITIQKHANI